jgi:hypothetical protein
VPRTPSYTEAEARIAVVQSLTLTETLRRLGLRPAGGNFRVLRIWLERWNVPIDHFDPNVARSNASRSRGRPLEEILVESSTYDRGKLKRRLYEAGLKTRRCELCGQGEEWRGRPMSLILDHVNGVADDHRLENLRIVCPNCAATLDTHCGRNTDLMPRRCDACSRTYKPRHPRQRYCSLGCAGPGIGDRLRGVPRPERRKVARPSFEQLLAEVEVSTYVAVAAKYGVSEKAVRKWVRAYEREGRRGAAGPPRAATLRA